MLIKPPSPKKPTLLEIDLNFELTLEESISTGGPISSSSAPITVSSDMMTSTSEEIHTQHNAISSIANLPNTGINNKCLE